MKNFTLSTILFVFWSFGAVPNIGFSQNDSIDKSLENQFLKMQQQMMENLKKHGFSDGNFSFMGDTSFLFQIDTSFYGEADEFFQQSPWGQQDLESGFPDFDQLIQRFFDLSEKGSKGDGSEYLDPEGDNELLPEERLREDAEKKTDEPAESLPKPDKSKSVTPATKRKTVRI